MISSILLAVQSTVPDTPGWTPTVGVIISISCAVSLLLALRVVSYPQVGPKFPGLPLSVPAFVGAMCFGHIIGVGIVLGLTNVGRI